MPETTPKKAMLSRRFGNVTAAVLLSLGPFVYNTPGFAACSATPAGTSARAAPEPDTLAGPPAEAFATLDRNHDGALTANELTAGRARLLELLDTNGDGVVSREEFVNAPLGPATKRIGAPQRIMQIRTARFQELDRNGDGVLSAEELSHASVAMIMDLRDVNCDGRITPSELGATRPPP